MVLLVASCAADVVLGVNHDGGSPEDGGALDGGASDASFVDAGDDGGATDAGLDAGTPDAGDADAGLDGGAADGGDDGGTPDAGLDGGGADGGLDGGPLDAGVDAGTPDDGGLADLMPFFSGALAVERADVTQLSVGVQNVGTRFARDAGLRLVIPLGLSFRAGASCLAATPQDVGCLLGDVPAGGVVTTTITLAADAGLGWRNLSAQSFTEVDTADANDVSTFPMAVTGVGAQVVAVNAPRLALLEGCFGTGLMSFSQCTPGGLLSSHVVFFADGGVEPADGGYSGSWGQAAHLRNLGFRFYFGPMTGRQYAGAATTASCFEGVSDVGTAFNVGAFRLCLQ